MVGLLVFEAAAITFIFQYYVEIGIVADVRMQRLISNFNNGINTTASSLDDIQRLLKCCGGTSYNDYTSSYPSSCCESEDLISSNKTTDCVEPTFTTPCVDAVSHLVNSTTLILVLILLSHTGSQVASFVVSCHTVRRRAKKDARLLDSYIDMQQQRRNSSRRSCVSESEE